MTLAYGMQIPYGAQHGRQHLINFELIVTDLWPFKGFGGHIGRHLEKKFSEAPILVNF